jgi:metal-responsive CopG/Arc/MetJ family transcriptional regulator
MPYRKTAIAMPEVLLTDVDRAAAERGESRSAYITRVLSVAVRAKRDAEITKKLNELFASEGLSKAQRRGTAALDALGSDWTDERW